MSTKEDLQAVIEEMVVLSEDGATVTRAAIGKALLDYQINSGKNIKAVIQGLEKFSIKVQ